jgi:hypothetical protein
MKECFRCEKELSSSDVSLKVVEGDCCLACLVEEKENRNKEYNMADKKKEVETKKVKVPKEVKKMTEQQKTQLKKHMDGLDMDVSGKRSHRMKMMMKMRKGMSVGDAHKEIMG